MAIHDMLANGYEVKDLFTSRGSHEGCGECCGRFLPLFPHEVVRLRHAAMGIELRPEQPGTIDMNCPLLDGDGMCMVYEARPEICRVYDCSRHKAEGAIFAIDSALQPGMAIYDMRMVCQKPAKIDPFWDGFGSELTRDGGGFPGGPGEPRGV